MKGRWGLLCVALCASAWFAWLAPYGSISKDEGWLVDSAWRVLNGQAPHRDFLTLYPAGRYGFMALLMAVSGKTVVAVRWGLALVRVMVSVLTYAVGRRMMPWPLALAATAAAAWLPGAWHKAFFVLVPLAVGLGWWHHLARRTPRSALLVGALAGALFWFRQDTAVFAGIGCAVVLLGELRHRGWRDTAQEAGWLLAGGVGAVAVGLLCLWPVAPPWVVLHDLLFRSVSAGSPDESLWQAWTSGNTARYGWRSMRFLNGSLAAIGVSGLWGLVVGLRGLGKGRSPAHLWTWCAVVLWLCSNQTARVNGLTRVLQSGELMALLWMSMWAWWAQHAGRRGGAWHGLQVAALTAALGGPVLLSGAAEYAFGRYPITPEFSGGLALRDRGAPLELEGMTYWMDAPDKYQLEATLGLLRGVTNPRAVLLIGAPTEAYALTGHHNPGPRVRWTPDEREMHLEVTRMVRRGEVSHILLDAFVAKRAVTPWEPLLEAYGKPQRDQGRYTIYKIRRARMDLLPDDGPRPTGTAAPSP